MIEFFRKLFDTSDFPPRWQCGNWTAGHGWLHIVSDIAIWSAYMAIPVVLVLFALRRQDLAFNKLYLLFAGFILACGFTHLAEAIIFWQPIYRVSGLIKLTTALFSWGTVLAMIHLAPSLLALPSLNTVNRRLNDEIELRKTTEDRLRVSERRQSALLEGTRNIVWTSDSMGRFLTPQPSWERFTGQTAEESSIEGWKDAVHPEDRDKLSAAWQQAVETRQPFYETIRLWRAVYAEHRFCELEAVPVLSSVGEIREWIGTYADIHKQSLNELALERARTETLQKKQELELIYDGAPIGLGLLDAENRYVRINSHMAKLNGMAVEAHLGKRIEDLFPGLVDSVAPLLARVRETGQSLVELEVAGKLAHDGAQHDWLVSSYPLEDGEGAAVCLIVQDITEDKLHAAALERTTGRLGNVLRSIADGFALVNRDWRFDYVNQTAAQLLGARFEQLQGREIWEQVPGLRSPEIAAHLRAAMRSETPSELEISYKPVHGPESWLEFRCYPFEQGLSLFVTDRTERQRTVERLRDAEAEARRLAAVVERSSDFIGISTPGGKAIYINEAGRRMVGIDKHCDVSQYEVLDFIADQDRELMESVAIPAMIDSGRWKGDVHFRHMVTGASIPTHWNAYAIHPPHSDLAEVWVTISPDLSEQRALEEALQSSEMLAQAANLAKSEFLANMSHEIRSPMAAVLGYADVLAGHLEDPDNLKCVAMIKRNGEHLLAIVNDILDLSRIEAGKFEVESKPLPFVELIQEVVELMRVRSDEQGIDLDVVFSGPVPKQISSDETRLRQVLINILGNAVKFTRKGRVRLVVQMMELSADPKLEIRIEDTGIGIAPEVLEDLFKPFSQADNSVTREFGGSGLGLTISKRLIEMLYGELRLSSEIGRGTIVSIIVPTGMQGNLELVTPTREIPRSRVADTGTKVRLNGTRILVVDDRRDVRYITQHLLEEAGARVITSDGGLDAIRRVAETAAYDLPFDLILMDMQMPEMDGYRAVTELREMGTKTPIIAVTAAAMKGDRERCMDVGCNAYLSKPVHSRTLIETCARILGELHQTPDDHALENGTSPSRLRPSGKLLPGNHASAPQRVLVVDDNPDVANLTALLLRKRGFNSITAENGETALVQFSEYQPNVVVLDIALPGRDGLEIARELRRMGFEGLLIALSGRSGHADRERSLAAGFDEHIVKPAAPGVLERTILRGRNHSEQ